MAPPKLYRAIRPMFQHRRWRITEGDEVVVRGTHFHKQVGKVLAVVRDTRVPQVIVEGINVRKNKIQTGVMEEDHLVVTMEHPIHYSSVNLVEPKRSASGATAAASASADADAQKGRCAAGAWPGVRAKFRYDQRGNQLRIGKGQFAQGRIIPWPPTQEEKPQYGGAKDTDPQQAAAATRVAAARADFASLLASSAASAQGSSEPAGPAAPAAAAGGGAAGPARSREGGSGSSSAVGREGGSGG